VCYHLDLCSYIVECKILLFLLYNCLLWLSSLLSGSCPSPPRVLFARISREDETQNFYAVGTTVKYICRPGYENTGDQLPTSTCLDNLTWAEVPELCRSECLRLLAFSPTSSRSRVRSAVFPVPPLICVLGLPFFNDVQHEIASDARFDVAILP